MTKKALMFGDALVAPGIKPHHWRLLAKKVRLLVGAKPSLWNPPLLANYPRASGKRHAPGVRCKPCHVIKENVHDKFARNSFG